MGLLSLYKCTFGHVKQRERELRSSRERLDLQAGEHRQAMAAQARAAEEAARQAAEALARAQEEGKELEQRVGEVQLALSTEAAERSVASGLTRDSAVAQTDLHAARQAFRDHS